MDEFVSSSISSIWDSFPNGHAHVLSLKSLILLPCSLEFYRFLLKYQHVSFQKIIEEITIISDSDSSDKKNKAPGASEKPKKPPLTEEQKREKKKKRVENLEIREFTNKVKTLVEKYKDQITPKVTVFKIVSHIAVRRYQKLFIKSF